MSFAVISTRYCSRFFVSEETKFDCWLMDHDRGDSRGYSKKKNIAFRRRLRLAFDNSSLIAKEDDHEEREKESERERESFPFHSVQIVVTVQ